MAEDWESDSDQRDQHPQETETNDRQASGRAESATNSEQANGTESESTSGDCRPAMTAVHGSGGGWSRNEGSPAAQETATAAAKTEASLVVVVPATLTGRRTASRNWLCLGLRINVRSRGGVQRGKGKTYPGLLF